jgi:type IV pilus assembly protein PilE
VLSVIGVLAGIAYPLYTQVIIKTRRIEAKLALFNLAARMENFFLINNYSYAGATLSKLGVNKHTEKHFYKLSVKSTADTYDLAATATFFDRNCQRLMLNHLGKKTSASNLIGCW